MLRLRRPENKNFEVRSVERKLRKNLNRGISRWGSQVALRPGILPVTLSPAESPRRVNAYGIESLQSRVVCFAVGFIFTQSINTAAPVERCSLYVCEWGHPRSSTRRQI